MPDKLTTLARAIAEIPDGSTVALGGNTLHRSPSAAVHELIRQSKHNLSLVTTAGAYTVDVLCGSGAVSQVISAYVGFESFGLAPRFRRGVEQGQVNLLEHT